MQCTKTIAEIGINHNGSIHICKQLITVAAQSGFQYVKLQKRDPDTAVPIHKRNLIRQTPWGTMTYIEYKHLIEFGKAEFDEIDDYCAQVGIKWFSSAFDISSIEFLAAYLDNSKAFAGIIKLGSAAAIELDLCAKAYELFGEGKVMVSLGMKTENEIKKCIDVAKPFAILHTVSVYPTSNDMLFLNYIKRMSRQYPHLELGYSGHECGLAPTFAAVALGCVWIERHITLDKNMWGTDQKASLDPIEMRELMKGLREIDEAMSLPEGERYLVDGEREKRAFFIQKENDEKEQSCGKRNVTKTGLVALIPARGGSKRIHRKNLRMLLGKPLVYWSIRAALDSHVFDNVVVSTEDTEIARVARQYGAEVHDRDPRASTDTALLEEVVRDFELNGCYDYKTLCILNPTNPLRQAGAIQSATDLFCKTPSADFLICAKPTPMFLWTPINEKSYFSRPLTGYGPEHNPLNKPRTQNVEKQWVETGAMYFCRRGGWDNVSSTDENTIIFEVNALQAVDIDENLDFVVAEVFGTNTID